MSIIVVILVIAVLVALVVAIPVLGSGFGKKGKAPKRNNGISLDRRALQAKWAEIESLLALGGASHLKNAVMEADKLTEKVLLSKGFAGATFAECLKSAKPKFTHYADYDNLWFAHKLRNGIVHDNGSDFNSASAKRAIEYYKRALKILGAL